MATIKELLETQTIILNEVLTTLKGLSPAQADDLKPVLDAVSAVATQVAAIDGEVKAIAAEIPVGS